MSKRRRGQDTNLPRGSSIMLGRAVTDDCGEGSLHSSAAVTPTPGAGVQKRSAVKTGNRAKNEVQWDSEEESVPSSPVFDDLSMPFTLISPGPTPTLSQLDAATTDPGRGFVDPATPVNMDLVVVTPLAIADTPSKPDAKAQDQLPPTSASLECSLDSLDLPDSESSIMFGMQDVPSLSGGAHRRATSGKDVRRVPGRKKLSLSLRRRNAIREKGSWMLHM